MRVINRYAVLVTPKKPYFDWAASIDDDAPDDVKALCQGIPSVYLFEFDPMSDVEEVALSEDVALRVFEFELGSWHDDDADWPPFKGLKTLREWFDVQVQDIVVDFENASDLGFH